MLIIENFNKKFNNIIVITIIVFIVLITSLWGNLTVGRTHYKITAKDLPIEFEGYKIAQISDLHNYEFGKDNSQIIKILKEESPNIIAITGDLIDSNHTDINIAIKFIQDVVKIAPCYYVTGNHEAWIGDLYHGLDDPDFTNQPSYLHEAMLYNKLEEIALEEGFKILLSHRPELYEVYVEHKIDLVLSGHAHGGQFRIPFIGGIVAPNQGFFPKYDAGKYHEANTRMIVSRGLGNSIIPVRINNRPEVVIIELSS